MPSTLRLRFRPIFGQICSFCDCDFARFSDEFVSYAVAFSTDFRTNLFLLRFRFRPIFGQICSFCDCDFIWFSWISDTAPRRFLLRLLGATIIISPPYHQNTLYIILSLVCLPRPKLCLTKTYIAIKYMYHIFNPKALQIIPKLLI
jgi:hypothetical protein